MIFLVVYDRRIGSLTQESRAYADEDRARASEDRLAATLAHAAELEDVEVLLLSAPSLADLHHTHARYFLDKHGLIERFERVLQERKAPNQDRSSLAGE